MNPNIVFFVEAVCNRLGSEFQSEFKHVTDYNARKSIGCLPSCFDDATNLEAVACLNGQQCKGKEGLGEDQYRLVFGIYAFLPMHI